MEIDEKLNNNDSSSEKEAKDIVINKDDIKSESIDEKSQLSKCSDDKTLSKDIDNEEIISKDDSLNDSEDILFSTGEYYHDHENYPSHITFKHPFVNMVSLLCGVLSSLFCICASPASIPTISTYLLSLCLIPSGWLLIICILFLYAYVT